MNKHRNNKSQLIAATYASTMFPTWELCFMSSRERSCDDASTKDNR